MTVVFTLIIRPSCLANALGILVIVNLYWPSPGRLGQTSDMTFYQYTNISLSASRNFIKNVEGRRKHQYKPHNAWFGKKQTYFQVFYQNSKIMLMMMEIVFCDAKILVLRGK